MKYLVMTTCFVLGLLLMLFAMWVCDAGNPVGVVPSEVAATSAEGDLLAGVACVLAILLQKAGVDYWNAQS